MTRGILLAVRDALRGARSDHTEVFALDALGTESRAEVWEALGRGEVTLAVQGLSRYEIDETTLPGVYRVRTVRDGGESLHLEVGAVPAVVAVAAERGTTTDLPLDEPPPPGLMNALPVLAELRHRMKTFAPGEENHVVSLTLLPMSDADTAYLRRALGSGPIEGESRGYGRCRVRLTARRGVWSVQHFNAMDALILDTLEVGGVPSSLVAAAQDLEDSATRLDELLGEGASSS